MATGLNEIGDVELFFALEGFRDRGNLITANIGLVDASLDWKRCDLVDDFKKIATMHVQGNSRSKDVAWKQWIGPEIMSFFGNDNLDALIFGERYHMEFVKE